MKIYNENQKFTHRFAIVAVVVLLAVPFFVLVNFVWLFGEIKFNQIKWQGYEFQNYEITANLASSSVLSGTYTLKVNNGEIVDVTVVKAR